MSDDDKKKDPTELVITVLPSQPVDQDPRPGGAAAHPDPPPAHRLPRRSRKTAIEALDTLRDFLLNDEVAISQEELTRKVNDVLEDHKSRILAFIAALSKVRAESMSALVLDIERIEVELFSRPMDDRSMTMGQLIQLYQAVITREKILSDQLNEVTKLSVPGNVRIKDEEAVLGRLKEMGLDIPNVAGRRNVVGLLDRVIRESQTRKPDGEPTN